MLKKTYLLWLFGLALLSPNLPAQTDCGKVTQIPTAECKALIALYNNTNGSQWKKSNGWLVTNTPCSWHGIQCKKGHVTRLYLQYSQLSGIIPPEIKGLSHLKVLNIKNNNLCGNIPVEIMNLNELWSFKLDNNHLTASDSALRQWLKRVGGKNWENSQTACMTTVPPQPPVSKPQPQQSVNTHSSFYNIAYKSAKNLANNAWKNIGEDCTKTSIFVQIVGNGVDDAINDIGTKYKGPSAEQFGNGFIDGLTEVLERVVARCVNECEMLGRANGEWSAKMFCRLAMVIKRAPTFTTKSINIKGSICGGSYRMGCESNFVGTTSNMCPNYTHAPSFNSFYRAAENGCCSYNPY
ncbi:MAG: hypothetical protein ABFS56_13050 [Pseudomonadota bacterium]